MIKERSVPLAIICWKTPTGHRGHGQPIRANQAKALAQLANEKFPDIQHWIIESVSDLQDKAGCDKNA